MITAFTFSETAISFSNELSLDKVVFGSKLIFVLSIFIVFSSNNFTLFSNSFILLMIESISVLVGGALSINMNSY